MGAHFAHPAASEKPLSNMQTVELEVLLADSFLRFRQQAVAKGIELKIINDIATPLAITADTERISTLLNAVLQGTVASSGASRISFSARQLLRTTHDVLLEFSLEHNGPLTKKGSQFRYLRTLVKPRRLIESLRGKTELDLGGIHGTSLKFVIRCACIEREDTLLCIEPLQGRQVLIVEDNEMNQRSLATLLKREGILVHLASDGREALDILEHNTDIDIILMDLHMPRMDGCETTIYLRRMLSCNTPVVGMSAEHFDDFALRCFEAGMNQFIQKPFRAELLMKQLASFFEPVYMSMQNVQKRPKSLSASRPT